MPDRILRDELLGSDRWLALPRNTHRLAFVCLIPVADPLGNMEAGDGHLWRLWHEPLHLIARAAVPEILEALVAGEMVGLYVDAADKRYLHIHRYKQRLRYLGRICPLSPWTTNEEKQRVEKISPGEGQAITGRAPAEVKRSEVEVKRREEKPLRGAAAAASSETWDSYSAAYLNRYATEPARNAKVNSQLANFVKRVGATDAPSIAAFYIDHDNRRYVESCHDTANLLRDAEALRTQWATGRKVTSTTANLTDRKAGQRQMFRDLDREFQTEENNGKKQS